MQKLSIAFASQDWSHTDKLSYPNGCTWYRCVLPSMAMNKRGHTCQVGVVSVADNKVGVRVRAPMYEHEGIYSGHRMLVFKLPMHTANLVAVDVAKTNKVKIVVDIDDWFDDLPDTNKAKQQTDPELNKENNRDIYFQVISQADALICSTPFLYDFYKNKYPGKPIFMIRNSIDVSRWPKKKPRKGIPTIGWVGATPWRANDLEQLSGFFDDYLSTRNNDFHHGGHIAAASSAAELLGIKSRRTTAQTMTPITNLPALFKQIDIGIVPLNDVGFNHAKSYLKGLEYAAAGVPFIASGLPEYEFLADHGVGRIAKNETEWIHHLDELQEFKIRDDESAVNLEIIKEKFSIETYADQWEHVYSNIMDIGQ